VELLNTDFASELATILVTCGIVSSVVWVLAFLVYTGQPDRKHPSLLFILTVFGFCLLGFVTGSIMSNSREPAVNAVLPAALTLLGGVAAFVVGQSDEARQLTVSCLVLGFALCLYIGSDYGATLRDNIDLAYSDNAKLAHIELFKSDVDRLEQYARLQKLKKDFEKKFNVDLSKFGTSYETVESEKKPEGEKKQEGEKKPEKVLTESK
jgi:hypothetical protein